MVPLYGYEQVEYLHCGQDRRDVLSGVGEGTGEEATETGEVRAP